MYCQHLGGIHSSCAISGIAWLVLMLVNQYKIKYEYNDSLLAFGVVLVVVAFITLIAGLPWVRNSHHKYVILEYSLTMADNQSCSVFERNHRFFGWTSLGMTWIYTILTNTYDVTDGEWSRSGVYVVRQQAFWYTVGMTLLSVSSPSMLCLLALTAPQQHCPSLDLYPESSS